MPARRAGSRGLLGGLPALVALLVACTGSGTGRRPSTPAPTSTAATRSGPSTTTPPPKDRGCPAGYAAPDPARPRITLDFDVARDLTHVQGRERIRFTPDRPVSELVFRLTANTAPTVRQGNGIRVTSATADHGARPAHYEPAGAAAGTQGGLLRVPFATTIPAGTTVSADLRFTVTLGAGSFDRFGRANGFAWFASAQPLLAWQRGYGWHTEPLIGFTAESATSEAARTSVTVTAASTDVVLLSGGGTSGTPTAAGRRRWRSELGAARDVSVAVGPFAVRDVSVGTTRLRVGAPSASALPAVVADERRAVTELSRRFGPFPFPSLSVALLPITGGGIEYPSSIFLLGQDRRVDVHETAHQWFYALVGNSQAQHAWLDEGFASYAEQLVDGDAPPASALAAPGRVDTPTGSYGRRQSDYYRVTYDKGSAALHAARRAAGAGRFDAAVRCYVNAEAWRIATPSDVATALAGLPGAVAVLRQAGALR